MPVTALYSGVLALLFVYLAIRVIQLRREGRVAVGDGGNALLLRRMRVHANFAEYVPLALILMALAESLHTWPWLLHLFGVTLVAGRLTHAYGVSQRREPFIFRTIGMVATFGVITTASLTCIAAAWRAGF